jgi:hypothetical protein
MASQSEKSPMFCCYSGISHAPQVFERTRLSVSMKAFDVGDRRCHELSHGGTKDQENQGRKLLLSRCEIGS